MKTKASTIILIILLSIITVVLSIFLGYILLNKNSLKILNFRTIISKDKIVDKTYEELFDEIEIDSKRSIIEIKENDKDEIKVVIYGEKEKIKVDDSNNKLKITSNNNCKFICLNVKVSKIEIYIPESYDKKISISNNIGDILLERFPNLDVTITLDTGDIKIDSLKSANIKSHIGDVIISDKVDKLNIVADCGDIKVNEVKSINANNKLGDIKITKVDKKIDLVDNCGDIKIEQLYISENSNITNNIGDVKIGKTNEIYIDAKTSIGETKITNNYHKSETVLKIKNNCGDIKVRN